MKKFLIATVVATTLFACTDSGEGGDKSADTPGTAKDTMTMTNSDGSTTQKDTTSYEGMPNKTSADTTGH